ncbi:MAG: hypothetical protein KAJ75_06415 [Alphaproteobacteria bacterium]|nr:hypothetical protein [Alphaproteobacteria bacterium]
MTASLKNAFDFVSDNGLYEDVSDYGFFRAEGTKEEKKRIEQMAATLAKSPTGKKTLQDIYKSGYAINFVSGTDILGFCDKNNKRITINAAFSNDSCIATIAHEARHAIQFDNGIDPKIAINNVKTYLMTLRTTEADAEANAGMTAWELKEHGITKPWEHFTNDSPYVAKAIQESVKKNGLETASAKKEALTEAFEGWHKNKILSEEYNQTYVDTLNLNAENGFAGAFQFDKNITGKELVSIICQNNGDVYYTKDPKRIESKDLLSISKATKDGLDNIMKARKQFGLEPDKSLAEISVYSDAHNAPVYSNFEAKQVEAHEKLAARKQVKTRNAINNVMGKKRSR